MKRIMIILALCLATTAVAQPPRTMNFQGTLADGVGSTLPDGNYNLTFRLWDADLGGATLWTEVRSVNLSAGIFTIVLGEVTPLVLPFDQPYWLGIQVGGGAELSPRSPLSAMPYALNVADGAVVQSLNNRVDDLSIVGGANITVNTVGNNIIISGTGALTDNDWNVVGNDMSSLPVGNVGIGTVTPGEKLDVAGNVSSGGDAQIGTFLARVGNGPVASTFGGTHGGHGSTIDLASEDGSSTTSIEPDVDGEGGFLSLYRSNAAAGFTVDGNYSGSNNTRVIISGSYGSSFLTDQAGDDAVTLPSNAVNQTEIVNEPGVASETGLGPIDLTTSYAALVSRSILCPTAGYVYVQASLEVDIVHVNGATSFSTVGVSDAPTSLPGNQDLSFYLPSAAASGTYLTPCAPSGMFPVSAGSNTFYLVGRKNASGLDVQAWDMQLNLIFFETVYGTVTGTQVGKEGVDQFSGTVPSVPAPGPGDLAAERAASEAFVRDRVEQELAVMRERIERLQGEVDSMNEVADNR